MGSILIGFLGSISLDGQEPAEAARQKASETMSALVRASAAIQSRRLATLKAGTTIHPGSRSEASRQPIGFVTIRKLSRVLKPIRLEMIGFILLFGRLFIQLSSNMIDFEVSQTVRR
jgi:hypothetical protein